jgi:hypothetical protein
MAHGPRVLISGASGPSRLVRFFRAQGRNAVDADDVPGLARFVDRDGTARAFPLEEGVPHGPLSRVWNATRLTELLDVEDEVYLFGNAENMYEFLRAFDGLYYLRASSARTEARLTGPAPEDEFGRPATQRALVQDRLAAEEERARAAGFRFVDAGLEPSAIFQEVCRPGVTKRRP